MVTANKSLLKWIRKRAIREELQAMRLRGRLVVPALPKLAEAGPSENRRLP